MTRRTTRRNFLGTAGALGAGLSAEALAKAGVWIAPASGAWERRSANEKINVALIGAGGRGGSNTAGVDRADGNIFALCDVDDITLKKASAKHPKAKTYHDFRKMLEEEKTIDAVAVSTPDHQHASASIMAMRMGRHCYCEKPLTHDVWEARKMTELAREKKLATQMGNGGHSGETIRRCVELIQSGAIGKVREAHSWSNRPIWPQAIPRPKSTPPVPEHLDWDLWLGTAPERPYHPAYHPFKWRGWWDFGTGALGDMACHIVDHPFWALNLGYPTSVEGICDVRMPETGPRWSVVTFEFPARGDMPPVTFKWWDGSKDGVLHQPPKELSHGFKIPKNGTLFVGEKGTLLSPHGRGGPILLPEEKFKDFEQPKPSIPRSPGHYVEWLNAIKGEGKPGSNFDYAGPLSEVILLGCIACQVEGKIEWNGGEMKAGNGKAQALVKREYRKGWEI